MNKNYYVFPGQGSQIIGMGKSLYDSFDIAKEIFKKVDDVLNEKLSNLMFSGDEKDLTLTKNAQPALLAVSAAIINIIKQHNPKLINDATCFAGHSLGEYSALYAGGVISLEDSIKLVRARGIAMQHAVPAGKGAMASVMRLGLNELEALVKEAKGNSELVIANDNSPGQIVISGDKEAIIRFVDIAKKIKIRVILLPVSAPFHSPLMASVATEMKELLESTLMVDASVPIVCNFTAKPEINAIKLRENLVNQVCGRVRWYESMELVHTNYDVNCQVECGSKKVLTGLLKRINPSINGVNLELPQDIEAWAK